MGAALTDAELLEIESNQNIDNEIYGENPDDKDDHIPESTTNTKKIAQGIDLVKQAIEIFKEFDSEVERRLEITTPIHARR